MTISSRSDSPILRTLTICRVCLFLLLITAMPSLLQAQEVYTNKTILDLKSAGLSKDVIKNMISSAPNCKFETDAQSVIKLKKAGIDDEVINAMITKMNPTAVAATPVSAVETKMPATGTVTLATIKKEGSGIYYADAKGISEIEPTVYSGKKTSSGALQSITYGFAKNTTRMTLNGNTANVTVNEKKPVFYFVFDKTESSLNDQGSGWLRDVSGPNEFQLVKVIVNKDKKSGKVTSREIETKAGNYYSGTEEGVSSKFKVDFKRKKLEEGVYEITFEEDLPPGEYCFMYAGANVDLYNRNPKVYDFAVK